MHKACQNKQWHFGMKTHAGGDMDSGLFHSIVTTAANVHDLTPAAELLHSEEEVVDAAAGWMIWWRQPRLTSVPR
jgi:transposase, IS5 family